MGLLVSEHVFLYVYFLFFVFRSRCSTDTRKKDVIASERGALYGPRRWGCVCTHVWRWREGRERKGIKAMDDAIGITYFGGILCVCFLSLFFLFFSFLFAI